MSISSFSKFKNRLYRSIPLIPLHSGLFIFIAILSPVTWSASGISYYILGLAALLGIICAYSTTIFVDDHLKIRP